MSDDSGAADGPANVPYRPALDGLRCLAALFVMLAHGVATVFKTEPASPWIERIAVFAGLGMTLFFVLSGFVIHHRYHQLWTNARRGAVGEFVRARFARLYPLYFLLLIYDWHATRAATVNAQNAPEALLYYLPLLQSWRYLVLGANSLIYQFAYFSSVTWSISVEVFLYALYLVAAGILIRVRRLSGHLLLGLGLFALALAFLALMQHQLVAIDRWAVLHFGPIAGLEHGVQDSFFRWLAYFFPLSHLMEFGLGCVAANWFRLTCSRTPRVAPAGWWLPASIGLCLMLMPAVYMQGTLVLSLNGGVVGAPIVAFILYLCCIDPDHRIARLLSSDWMRKGGDASYGIYLLHIAVFHWYGTPTFALGAAPILLLSIKLVLMFVQVVILARLVYVALERPVRSMLRGQMRWRAWPDTVVVALSDRLVMMGVLLVNHVVLNAVQHQIMERLR